jgi:hypothetical protein
LSLIQQAKLTANFQYNINNFSIRHKMKFVFAVAALTSMVTFATAAPQASSSIAPVVNRPPHVYLSTDKCTITQAVDKPEGQGWGWKGGNAWIFEFKDTYIKEKFNVAYYPEKNGDCDFAATAQLKLQVGDNALRETSNTIRLHISDLIC